MNSGTRVLGYVRCSTLEQSSKGVSLEAQEAAIRSEGERRGWLLIDIVRDEGTSGKSLERPGLRQALERIAAGEAQGLVVSKLDRLSRSVVDFGTLLEWFESGEATLVALDLNIDTSSASGRLVASVFASVAEWEREVIATRTREGLAAVRAQGRPISRAAVADHPRLAERIRAMREVGCTLQAIADTLNRENVPTLRGAAEWSRAAVHAATGYKRPRPRRRRVDLPPIKRRRVA